MRRSSTQPLARFWWPIGVGPNPISRIAERLVLTSFARSTRTRNHGESEIFRRKLEQVPAESKKVGGRGWERPPLGRPSRWKSALLVLELNPHTFSLRLRR